MRRNTWLSLAATVAAVATGAGAAFAAQGPGTDAPRAGTRVRLRFPSPAHGLREAEAPRPAQQARHA